MSRIAVFSIVAFLFIAFAMLFRPVPAATTSNTIDFEGVVSNIKEGGIKDVVFSFQNSNKNPYINRGLENGLNLEELRTKLLNKQCKFKFIDSWTPLPFENRNPTVAFIETSDGLVIYNAIKY